MATQLPVDPEGLDVALGQRTSVPEYRRPADLGADDLDQAEQEASAPRDPCLTTWEARRLSAWLHRAADGGAARGQHITFTEPNLAFSLGRRRAGRARLHVCFSHEALPPWAAHDHDGWQAGQYVLTLDISQEDLARAARAWDLEHGQFPER